MDELDEAVDVFDRDGLVLLLEVVYVTVEDFDEELHGHCGVHASVGNAEGTLETFEDTFAITIDLGSIECQLGKYRFRRTKKDAYTFRLLPFVLWRVSHPPEVAGQVDCATLIWLLQQLTTMQGCLCDKGIVVFPSKSPRAMKRASNDTHSLELCSGVADGVLVYGESLCEELVTKLFKANLVGYLGA